MSEQSPLPPEAILDWMRSVRAKLDAFAAALRSEIEDGVVSVFSESVGSRTDLQGHDVGIEVVFFDDRNVALSITVGYLTTTPCVLDASVGWNEPSGYEAEIDLPGEKPIATDAVLRTIDEQLPTLTESFRTAVLRGRPVVR